MRLLLALLLLCSATAHAKEYAPQVDKKAEAEKQEEQEYERTHFFDRPALWNRQPFFGAVERRPFFNAHKDRGAATKKASALRRR